ncbi:helix-turn-helix transcriptional regulator [Desnuesiella massiliensis]|uniref:helix-turn-helix transcriptional regulator n=1 Tax=Desnuesiella massiliensis TaxID=1650662 RepID=UPI0006E2459E|nr:AraC family transcriptional regulator [Desnuesiella massiliensis]
MNYYDRIQESIEYIESNLESYIDLDIVASKAYMLLSNFYRMFFALTGHSVKEYIRKRRMNLAINDITVKKSTILNIAIKYGFESGDAFSRAFRHIVGCNPSTFKKHNIKYSFERMSVLDKYYDVQDRDLLERYPDIKVLKKLEPMKVAYYRYYGKSPEYNAFKVLLE